MKVVHIASGDLWAGAEKQLLSLACALRHLPETEVEAIVLNPGTLAEQLQAAGIPTLVLDESRMPAFALFRAILAQLRKVQPALVHTHRTKENMLGAIAASTLGIPSLRTQHGSQEHVRSWHDLRRIVLGAGDYLVGRFLQRRIVAVSTPLERELQTRYGAHHIVTIANGIEPGAAPVPRNLGDSAHWTIGIVGRLVPVKRVDLFLDMAAILATGAARISFRVIGDGPLRRDLERQEQTLPRAIDLHFLGHLTDAEAAIAALDILVICSDHEGLPMVALEAMKAGTVVVTHRIGGLPELLDEGSCGIVVEQHAPTAFADAIALLLDNPGLAAGIGQRARQRIELYYSAPVMARKYRDLYTALANT